MILELTYGVLAGIGFAVVLYYAIRIFFELMYLFIFMFGYLILHLLNYNWQKVKRKPYFACIETLKVIKYGFFIAFDSPTELRLGVWSWRPLFRFRRYKVKANV